MNEKQIASAIMKQYNLKERDLNEIVKNVAEYDTHDDVIDKIADEELTIYASHGQLMTGLLVNVEFTSTLRSHIQTLLAIPIEPGKLINRQTMSFAEYVTEFFDYKLVSGHIIQLTGGKYAYVEMSSDPN